MRVPKKPNTGVLAHNSVMNIRDKLEQFLTDYDLTDDVDSTLDAYAVRIWIND